MLSKKEIKDIQSLSHKKFRDELNLFVAEGPKVVGELIKLIPQQILKLYAVEDWMQANESFDLKTSEVSDFELEKLSQLQTPNQVVAVINKLPSKTPDASTFTLYLDTIQDPGNLGTIIRIADWFGVHDIVCSEGCADLYNPKVVQATMASIARVNVFYDRQGDWLHGKTVPVYAAALKGKSLYETAKTTKGILIIGNESKGLGEETLSFATEHITIPRKGGAESLNAAVATGIILSHLLN
ncbi:MAG: TrmH family RNA methyltransferase [Flavisolibacter sp.]